MKLKAQTNLKGSKDICSGQKCKPSYFLRQHSLSRTIETLSREKI